MDSTGLFRGRKTEAACYDPDSTLTMDPSGFVGQAELRLSTFILRFQPGSISENSICEADKYPSALSVIADNIIRSHPADCLRQPPIMVSGTPECVVGCVDASNPTDTPR